MQKYKPRLYPLFNSKNKGDFFMAYSLDLLKTKAECDAILAYAERETRALERRKVNKDFDSDQTTEIQTSVASKLATVSAKLAVIDGYIAGLPEGKDKRKELIEKERLEYQKKDLESRQLDYNTLSVLDSELDVERVERELAAIAAFVAEVNTKKAALPS